METISEAEFLSLFPPAPQADPAEIEESIERLLECAQHASASGDAARAVIRAVFGGQPLELHYLTRLDRFNRDAALTAIRAGAENPGFDGMPAGFARSILARLP